MATADNSRSTRGGNASTSSSQRKMEDQTARSVVDEILSSGWLLVMQDGQGQSTFTHLHSQVDQMEHLFSIRTPTASTVCS